MSDARELSESLYNMSSVDNLANTGFQFWTRHKKHCVKLIFTDEPIIRALEGYRMCYITLDNISRGEMYMCCSNCHRNFIPHAIQIWISKFDKCPICKIGHIDPNLYIDM